VFGDTNALQTSASFDLAGDYVLSLTANDGDLISSDTLNLTVNEGAVLSDPQITPFEPWQLVATSNGSQVVAHHRQAFGKRQANSE